MTANTRLLMAAVGTCALAALLTCSSSPVKRYSEAGNSNLPGAQGSDPGDLQTAMDRLQASLEKPASAFHASFKKSGTDGFASTCEADVSSQGITGEQTEFSPPTKVGSEVFAATSRRRELNGVPYHSQNWYSVYSGISMTFLSGHIRDAQPGVKYAGEEQTGGFDARRYDFDLAGVDADIKRAMSLGQTAGLRQTKDYNMKGSAWVAKEDGRMVKFRFDNIFTFTDGRFDGAHFEGSLTKK
jgi:hypothetical protein